MINEDTLISVQKLQYSVISAADQSITEAFSASLQLIVEDDDNNDESKNENDDENDKIINKNYKNTV